MRAVENREIVKALHRHLPRRLHRHLPRHLHRRLLRHSCRHMFKKVSHEPSVPLFNTLYRYDKAFVFRQISALQYPYVCFNSQSGILLDVMLSSSNSRGVGILCRDQREDSGRTVMCWLEFSQCSESACELR